VSLWEEHGLFVGNAGAAESHESPAIKVCIALVGTFGLSGAKNECRDYRAAVIPAGVEHAIDGRGNRIVMLLLAPEGILGQRLNGVTSVNEIVPLDRNSLPDLKAIGEATDEQSLAAILASLVKAIATSKNVSPSATIDPRVAQSIEWIRAGRDSGILVKDLAAEADLSESRFSHLFTENVRVPVRRYLLWLRLRDVLHLLASTGSLTEAAHSAGFADSAHLSRTFRTALGIAPSDLTRESTITSFLK